MVQQDDSPQSEDQASPCKERKYRVIVQLKQASRIP